jgi:hypothetical protein
MRRLNDNHDSLMEEEKPSDIQSEAQSQVVMTDVVMTGTGESDSVWDADEEESDDDAEEPGCSLFDLHMPGVMTKKEVNSQIDLDHWLLFNRDRFIEMQVRCPIS